MGADVGRGISFQESSAMRDEAACLLWNGPGLSLCGATRSSRLRAASFLPEPAHARVAGAARPSAGRPHRCEMLSFDCVCDVQVRL